MKSLLKSTIITSLILLATTNTFSQTASKDVSITASGSGKTLEGAKQAALRSAIEQAFGAFISSKTEMLNDQVVADQMASVSSGNIKSFSILNESQLPDGSWGVTLKALVSVDKLTSFVEAKGIAIEIKGGMFAINIKQQLLNEQGEIKAVSEMVGLLHEPMQIAFDYVIKSSDPKALDDESKNWEIPLEVIATANKNIDFCANYFIKTISALSLSSEEAASYKSLNKDVFPITINHNGNSNTFYLRKKLSYYLIFTLINQWKFYTRQFTMESGLDESYGNSLELITEEQAADRKSFHFDFFGIAKSHRIITSEDIQNKGYSINFLTSGQLVASFSWQDKRTLSQIEKMTGYKVKPSGVTSQFKHGGFVVYERNGHGLVAAITDLGLMEFESAKTACNELVLNGYSDWRLPTIEELNKVYFSLARLGVGGFGGGYYLSSTKERLNSTDLVLVKSLPDGAERPDGMFLEYNVRAIRAF